MATGTEEDEDFVADGDVLEVENYITNHPLTQSLRDNVSFTESRANTPIPKGLRPRTLTSGTLAGPERITVSPFLFHEDGGKSLIAIFHLGHDVCGHPDMVHGGLLATLLDEALARCCFPALPNRVAVTANLNIDYRRPAMAGSYFALKATTVRVEGRKAWVEGRIENLPSPASSDEGELLVEAKGLFIEPRQAAVGFILSFLFLVLKS